MKKMNVREKIVTKKLVHSNSKSENESTRWNLEPDGTLYHICVKGLI